MEDRLIGHDSVWHKTQFEFYRLDRLFENSNTCVPWQIFNKQKLYISRSSLFCSIIVSIDYVNRCEKDNNLTNSMGCYWFVMDSFEALYIGHY